MLWTRKYCKICCWDRASLGIVNLADEIRYFESQFQRNKRSGIYFIYVTILVLVACINFYLSFHIISSITIDEIECTSSRKNCSEGESHHSFGLFFLFLICFLYLDQCF